MTSAVTLTGCYRSSDVSVPAVKISTTEAVVLDHARIEHAGYGVADTVTGTHVTTRDTIYQQLPITQVVSHRAIELDGVADFTAEYNRLIDGDGIWLSGSGTTGPVTVRNNEAANIGRYQHPTSSNCCVQFLQLDHVVSAQIEVAWNKVVNTPGQSGGDGDQINFWYSGGTDSAHRSDVHHNLIDGAYPDTLNNSEWYGGGIMIGDGGDAHNLARNNVVVSATNYGIGLNGVDNYGRANLLVNDAVEQSSTFGQAVQAYDNMSPVELHTSDNRYNWKHSTTDSGQYACYQSTYCGNGVQVNLTEQQARDEWEAGRVAAGSTVGPR